MPQVWRPSSSLATSILRLVGLAALVACLGALFSAGISVYVTERAALLATAEHAAKQYAERAADAVLAFDSAGAQVIARDLAAVTGATRVVILDADNDTVATTVADPLAAVARGPSAALGRAWNGMVGGYELSFPLRVAGFAAGRLEMSLPSSRPGGALFSLVALQLLATLILTAAALALTKTRRLAISEPINGLLTAMENVSTNQDYAQKLEPRGPSEVGSLILNFNEMMAQLQLRDQRLAEQHRDLQEQVLERTRSLEDVAKAAEKSSRAKGDFLARMSHEIRTPMNGVVGMAELLGNSELDSRQRGMLKTMRTSADALLEIINDILDFSKIEAEFLQILSEDFELREIAEEVCELLAPRAHARGLELVIEIANDVPEWGNGDPLRIRQVLTNLVGNAIKYTETGQVVVRLSRDGNDDQQFALLVEVEDTGAGIPEEEQARVWEAFTQVDTFESRKHGGTGLGLAITRQLVTLMSGTVGLRSQVGLGTTFWFRLPLANPRREHKPVEWSLRGTSVLVAVANEAAGATLQRMLEASGAWTAVANTGQRALQRLTPDCDFGLVFMDQALPDMEGLELLEKMRAVNGLPAIPVIMLAAGDPRKGDSTGGACEPDEWLAKPVRRARMRQIVDRALGRASREDPRATDSATAVLRSLGLNILLVEDSPVNTEVAIGMLETLGCAVTPVSNGALGVENALGQNFDAVLMDCQMPLMDGYEATRKIRSGEKHKGRAPVPVIAITANALPGDRERCIEAGMTDFVSKPFTLKRLASVLRMVAGSGEPRAPRAKAPVSSRRKDSRLPLLELSQIDEMRALGRPELVRKTLLVYLRQSATLLNELDAALAAKDIKTAERAAHTLRSSSLTVGGRRFAALAGICETDLRKADLANAVRHAERLRPAFAKLSKLLTRIIDPPAERVA